jgi:uncharacterized Zn finger protein
MKSLSESVIATLAGEAAYARGLKYYNEGRVARLTIVDTQISASVDGQQPYQVRLNHTAKMFDGSCDCPASDNFDFCKHCVAVSLAYYYQTQTNLEMADAGAADTLRLYLNTFTKPQLIEELNQLIESDQSVYDHWLLRAEIASGNLSSKDLRKRITQSIPYKPSGLWRPQEVAHYFSEVKLALKVLEQAVLALDAHKAIKLVIYAIERVEKALETIEDRAAYQGDLQTQLKDWFHQTLSSTEWQNDERVTLLSKLILDEKFSYQTLNLPNGVLALISNKESEDLMEAISKAWNKMPPPSKTRSGQHGLYARLESMLLEDAQLLNNKTRELDVLAKGAVDTDRCLKLVGKCIDYQRLDEASKWLDYASVVQTLRSHDVAAIESYQIDLWLAQGEFDKALAAQWARFEESEDPSDLKESYQTAEKIHQERAYLQQGIVHLNSKIEARQDTPRNRQRVENLIAIYLSHNIVDDAIALASQHKIHPGTLMAIVNAAPRHSQKTCALAERAVNNLVNLNSNETIDRANWFLQKLYANAKADDKTLIQTVIQRIYTKPDNKRKSRFIKQLKANFEFL